MFSWTKTRFIKWLNEQIDLFGIIQRAIIAHGYEATATQIYDYVREHADREIHTPEVYRAIKRMVTLEMLEKIEPEKKTLRARVRYRIVHNRPWRDTAAQPSGQFKTT